MNGLIDRFFQSIGSKIDNPLLSYTPQKPEHRVLGHLVNDILPDVYNVVSPVLRRP